MTTAGLEAAFGDGAVGAPANEGKRGAVRAGAGAGVNCMEVGAAALHPKLKVAGAGDEAEAGVRAGTRPKIELVAAIGGLKMLLVGVSMVAVWPVAALGSGGGSLGVSAVGAAMRDVAVAAGAASGAGAPGSRGSIVSYDEVFGGAC